MPDFTRREFAETILKCLTLYSFVGAAISSQAMDSALRHEARVWSAQINDISTDLRARTLTPIRWQEGVEEVLSKLICLSFLPDDTRYNASIFGMRNGRSIVPHGHHNVVSGHLIIDGNLHVRNFE